MTISSFPGTRLGLAPGLRVVERDGATLQIGVDAPRRVLVRHPPPAAAEVLRLIDSGVPVSLATRRVATARGLAPGSWDDLIDDLIASGFLIEQSRVSAGRHPAGNSRTRDPRTALPPSSPPSGPCRLEDAVVVVMGTGRVASSLASLVAAAGIGHVHLDPDRAIRPSDAAPAGLAAELVCGPGRAAPDSAARTGRTPADRGSHTYERRGPRQWDREVLASTLRRSRPEVMVHRPAGYVRPGLVVLATDSRPDPVLTRRLVMDDQPHLAVHAGQWRGVVGPLVIPGRSSCLHCHDLYRRDRDAGWPHVRMSLQGGDAAAPVVLATAVAAVGADQALQFLGGAARPATVDGTLESAVGDWTVRRRSWSPHPACFCQSR